MKMKTIQITGKIMSHYRLNALACKPTYKVDNTTKQKNDHRGTNTLQNDSFNFFALPSSK